jgi:steroid delta-isomerase-like uncharacterized protein
MIDANKRVVHRWFEEVWNQGREVTIDELFSAHSVAYGLGEAGVEVRGPEQFKPFWRNLRDAFPDLRISIEDTIAENDRVVVRVILEGTHRGSGVGIPPSGRRVRVSGTVIVRLADGKMVEAWNDWDQLGMLRQIDAAPASAGDARFVTGKQ